MKRIAAFILTAALIASCAKLDNQLFDNDPHIDAYLLDDYKGEQDFVLGDDYHIDDRLIQKLTLPSQAAGESSATAIRALFLGEPDSLAHDTVILYCHGTKWHMDFYWQRTKLLAHVNGKLRYSVMTFDYRGYGLSEGKPTESGMYADADACMQWLKARGLTSDRLIIYGFSLGSAPACELTAHPRSLTPQKIILESPFASAAVMVADGTQLDMPASFVTSLKIDNAEEIRLVQQPLFWLHGDADNFLSYKTHGLVVYNNHDGAFKDSVIVKGAGHSGVPQTLGFQNYLRELGNFIRR